MRRLYVTGLVVVVSTVLVLAQAPIQADASQLSEDQLPLFFGDETVVKVEIPGSPTAEFIWAIQNSFDYPIEFVSASASCGCSKVDVSINTLQPDEKGNVRIVTNSSRAVGGATESRSSNAFMIAVVFKKAGDSEIVRPHVAKRQFEVSFVPMVELQPKELKLVEQRDKSTTCTVIERSRTSWIDPEISIAGNELTGTVAMAEGGSQEGSKFEIELSPTEMFDWNEPCEVELKLFAGAGVSGIKQLVFAGKLTIRPEKVVQVAPANLFFTGDTAELTFMTMDPDVAITEIYRRDGDLVTKPLQGEFIVPRLFKAKLDRSELGNGGDGERVFFQVNTTSGTYYLSIPAYFEGER
jgi:hypothetical protein